MPPKRTVASREKGRLRDLLRYYQPDKHYLAKPKKSLQTSTTGKDAFDPSNRLLHDPILTAFAQLGAFRLNCERALISLISQGKQYVLAEATRSLSLTNPDHYDTSKPQDKPFLGPRALHIWWGLCPNAIPTFTALDDSRNIRTDQIVANQECYVMNDLSIIEKYRNRPYVAGFPFFRFYAEIPIVSPANYVIGSYCVIDNKPRDGLQKGELHALNEVASAVMQYLGFVTMQHSLQRAGSMVKGLGLFVDGKSSVQEWLASSEGHVTAGGLSALDMYQSKLPYTAVQTLPKTSVEQDTSSQEGQESSRQSSGVQVNLAGQRAESEGFQVSPVLEVPNPVNQPSSTSSTTDPSEIAAQKGSIASAGIKQLFARASNLIREALVLPRWLLIS